MSLRAIWIIPVNKDAHIPIFTRYFPSVEIRCRLNSDLYVKIPPEKELVKALLTEVGVKDGDVFVESRDRCNKQVLYPAFQLEMEDGSSLWPVVVMESKGHIYCALPYEEHYHVNPAQGKVTLAKLPSVSMALEVLIGLANCVASSASSGSTLTQGSSAMSELVQFVSSSLPFGRPICCDASIAKQLLAASGRGKVKHPAWNPVPHKAKSQIILHVKEEIRCMQYNHTESKDAMDVYGTVTCKAEVEGIAPEISLVLTQPQGCAGRGGVVVNSAVSSVENISNKSTRLRFRPCNSSPLCHYVLPALMEPPIHGAFNMKITDNTATIYLQLQLLSGVKNLFQQLEVQVPFPGFYISRLKPDCSLGSIAIQSKTIMVWNLGSKFPSKSLNATLKAVVRLKPRVATSATSAASSASTETSSATQSTDFSIGGSENVNNTYAAVIFKIADYTYSNTKVDPQSIIVSTAPKVRCSISCECVSNVYKIWNSEGEVPVIADSPVEELQTLLEQGCNVQSTNDGSN